MKFLRKVGFITITELVCFILANALSLPVLKANGMLLKDSGAFNFGNYLPWIIFWFITFMMVAEVILSHRFSEGRLQELGFYFSSALVISEIFSYVLYTFIECGFDLSIVDWFGSLCNLIKLDITYYGLLFASFALFTLFYIFVIDKDFVLKGNGGLKGKGKLKQVGDSNLENSRWMSREEKRSIFKYHRYSRLSSVKKDGIPVKAKLTYKNRDLEVAFQSPCHALVIGSTGSGKTTTFVSPMIQLLGATSAGSSMIMTDPKGELFSLHSKFLVSRGYDVKVIDLRDTYSSYRWNPLDSIWDTYESYRKVAKNVFKRRDDALKSGLKLRGNESKFKGIDSWFEFDGTAFYDYNMLLTAVKIYRKKLYDEVYEDLNDLVSVLIPVENEKDPMWEKGARSIVLATLLAMLEDSENPDLKMTKEKFNFFNLAKILQNSNGDYIDLRNYFKGRSALSKALSLSKQVCDAATQTRASYMSIVYEKLTLFNDAGICALTSASDFNSAQLAEKPTALFLKIPDEKDTRHNLAAIFILNIYKTLIKVASATEELTLDRNVYFIMDEFGNMPKIEKFDKFITVGRSRKIWFTMIVQSYAQLNNVYGETVADIVKGNCGVKMFIGSNDMNTCKEYSELCGNITVVTTSTSGSVHGGDVSLSAQTQVRPLIYPSELQRLNHPGDIGHSIIVTFGNYPLKTYFSPSFKVPFYKTGKMDTSELDDKFFDEKALFYDIKIRNSLILKKDGNKDANGGKSVAIGSVFAEGQGKKEAPKTENNVVSAGKEDLERREETPDITKDEMAIIAEFRVWKDENPNGTFNDYCLSLIPKSGYVPSEKGEINEN